MIGKSLKARRQNEAIGKLFDEAGMKFFPTLLPITLLIIVSLGRKTIGVTDY